jgi:hypothetical protein
MDLRQHGADTAPENGNGMGAAHFHETYRSSAAAGDAIGQGPGNVRIVECRFVYFSHIYL